MSIKSNQFTSNFIYKKFFTIAKSAFQTTIRNKKYINPPNAMDPMK